MISKLSIPQTKNSQAIQEYLSTFSLSEQDRVELLEKIHGPLTLISDVGFDSSVYLTSSNKENKEQETIKIYQELAKKVGLSEAFRIVNQYSIDTLKAQEETNKDPNPMGSFVAIEGIKYPLHFIVIPQGKPVFYNNSFVYSAGQKYINGESITGHFYEFDKGNKECFISKKIFHELETHLSWFTGSINDKLSTNFWLSVTNAKPKLDKENQRLLIYATDLGNNLYDHYVENKVL